MTDSVALKFWAVGKVSVYRPDPNPFPISHNPADCEGGFSTRRPRKQRSRDGDRGKLRGEVEKLSSQFSTPFLVMVLTFVGGGSTTRFHWAALPWPFEDNARCSRRPRRRTVSSRRPLTRDELSAKGEKVEVSPEEWRDLIDEFEERASRKGDYVPLSERQLDMEDFNELAINPKENPDAYKFLPFCEASAMVALTVTMWW